jgi:hypothetical protein
VTVVQVVESIFTQIRSTKRPLIVKWAIKRMRHHEGETLNAVPIRNPSRKLRQRVKRFPMLGNQNQRRRAKNQVGDPSVAGAGER